MTARPPNLTTVRRDLAPDLDPAELQRLAAALARIAARAGQRTATRQGEASMVDASQLKLVIGPSDAARLCNVSRATFYRWIAHGVVPEDALIRASGHHIRVRRRVLEAWLHGKVDVAAEEASPGSFRAV